LFSYKLNLNIPFRFYLYNILTDFLIIQNRSLSLEQINIIMNQISTNKIKLEEKDFKLLKIIEILIKEYKKI